MRKEKKKVEGREGTGSSKKKIPGRGTEQAPEGGLFIRQRNNRLDMFEKKAREVKEREKAAEREFKKKASGKGGTHDEWPGANSSGSKRKNKATRKRRGENLDWGFNRGINGIHESSGIAQEGRVQQKER